MYFAGDLAVVALGDLYYSVVQRPRDETLYVRVVDLILESREPAPGSWQRPGTG
jgi:hypothetical protein